VSDEILRHDLECNHRAVNRPGPSIYSRAISEIDRLQAELKEATESRQRLILDNACWQAENRKLGNELAAKSEPTQPAALAWTKKPPTEPGWYWARRPGLRCASLGIVRIDRPESIPVGCDYEWAGPIPEPQEPAS
jgi:hypothetical protein